MDSFGVFSLNVLDSVEDSRNAFYVGNRFWLLIGPLEIGILLIVFSILDLEKLVSACNYKEITLSSLAVFLPIRIHYLDKSDKVSKHIRFLLFFSSYHPVKDSDVEPVSDYDRVVRCGDIRVESNMACYSVI